MWYLMMMLTNKSQKTRNESTVLYNHVSANLSELDVQMVRSIRPGGNWQDIPLSVAQRSARVMRIRSTGGRTTYYGRLRPDLPSYTINTYFNRPGNGTFIHPAQDRLISFREAARLQSFPDDYRFLGSNSSMYKQIGNAVPPLLARAIGGLVKPGLCVDVFSGAGGLSCGLRESGHEVIIAGEKEPHMRATYTANHEGTTVIDVDFSKAHEIEEFIAQVESHLGGRTLQLLAGGPPCQGFSMAGKWDKEDPRNNLILSMFRMVESLCPEFVLIENVTGLRIRNKGAALDRILSSLREIGYLPQWFQLGAEEYGVPQRRRRIFIIASRTSDYLEPPRPMFSAIKDRRRNDPASQREDDDRMDPISVGEAISDLPEIASGEGCHEMPYDVQWIQSNYQRFMRGHITFEEFLRKQVRES